MMKQISWLPLLFAAFATNLIYQPANACTNLLVTRGASLDGSVYITYTCDGEFHPHLSRSAAADHAPGTMLDIKDWSGNLRGQIKQVPHTYAVVGMMNEHQLAISETTFGGREELRDPAGVLHYYKLIQLALERARTAREAIRVMTDLVAEYGYSSTGESFSIGDTEEAWILEMIGTGPGGSGPVWVAVKVPDGYIACHANKARIGTFPVDDPDNCLHSSNIIDFAVERGYFDPKSGQPFRFNDAYCPPTPKNQRYAGARVWSIFRRAAPSRDFSPDYHRAVEDAEPYPLWIKPDKKLSTADIFALMRDHYEGTPYDMTQGVEAGPYGTPNRWRPIHWKVDGVEHAWERPISTQQTGFAFVSQSRAWLPDPVGGLYWYAVDDTYTNCFVPLYCGIDALPASYTVGGMDRFSWDSAWWVFNFVGNYVNLRYDDMVPEVQAAQREIEETFLALQPAVEKTAVELAATDPALLTRYLTDYSLTHAELTVKRWRSLGEYLIRKYNDGYVQEQPGNAKARGYSDEWLQRVVTSRPKQLELPQKKESVPESKLVD